MVSWSSGHKKACSCKVMPRSTVIRRFPDDRRAEYEEMIDKRGYLLRTGSEDGPGRLPSSFGTRQRVDISKASPTPNVFWFPSEMDLAFEYAQRCGMVKGAVFFDVK
jgi:hypothetical protein